MRNYQQCFTDSTFNIPSFSISMLTFNLQSRKRWRGELRSQMFSSLDKKRNIDNRLVSERNLVWNFCSCMPWVYKRNTVSKLRKCLGYLINLYKIRIFLYWRIRWLIMDTRKKNVMNLINSKRHKLGAQENRYQDQGVIQTVMRSEKRHFQSDIVVFRLRKSFMRS